MTYNKNHNLFYFLVCAILFFAGDNVFSIENNTDKAKYGISVSYNNLGEYDKSLPMLEELADKYPDDRDIQVELARAFGYSGKVTEAVYILQELMKNEPDSNELTKLYCSILEANQQFEKARAFYLRLYNQEPLDSYAEKVAEISCWLKDYDTAIEYYNLVLSKSKDDRELIIKIGDVCLWAGKYEQAIEYYDKAGIGVDNDEKRFKDTGYCYLNIKQYEKAAEIFESLAQKHPEDVDYKIALVDVYYSMGQVDKVRVNLEKLIEVQPENAKLVYKLAEIYAASKEYPKALKLCKQFLDKQEYNQDIKLLYARVLSWNRQYDESVKVYDELIESNKKNTLFRREKARVLGWDRKYEEAIEEYQKAVEIENAGDDVISDERDAKYGLYNNYDKMAMKHYIRWLEAEPDNMEALYDLGQVYSRQGRWEQADKMYNQVLDIYPGHYRAADALKKVDIYANKTEFKSGFEFLEADSGDRNVDERYWDVSASLRSALNENYYITAGQNNTWYDYTGLRQIYRQRFSVKLEYFNKPDFWASANYAHSIFSGDRGVENTFGGQLNFKPADPLTIQLSHQRREVLDNSFTFRNQLYRDDYLARVNYDPSRRLRFGIDYMRSRYSDGNTRDEYGFDMGYFILLEPKSLEIKYRYEHYGFDKQNQFYFTPGSFYCHNLGLQWKHFLNKQELYWGSNDTFYTLGYEVKLDSQNEIGHCLKASFEHDWNDSCKSGIEWSRIMYVTSSVYSENRIMFFTQFYF